MGVYSGEYDAGSIREGALEILKHKIDLKQIRVLATTPWYPGWVYAARKGLDPALVEKIKKAETAVQRLVTTVFSVTAGAAVIALVMGTLFAGTVTRRLNILRRSAEEMVKGNMDQQTGPAPRRYCWEIMNCEKEECPAYGDRLQRCWSGSISLTTPTNPSVKTAVSAWPPGCRRMAAGPW